jgi:hypothetical protein
MRITTMAESQKFTVEKIIETNNETCLWGVRPLGKYKSLSYPSSAKYKNYCVDHNTRFRNSARFPFDQLEKHTQEPIKTSVSTINNTMNFKNENTFSPGFNVTVEKRSYWLKPLFGLFVGRPNKSTMVGFKIEK